MSIARDILKMVNQNTTIKPESFKLGDKPNSDKVYESAISFYRFSDDILGIHLSKEEMKLAVGVHGDPDTFRRGPHLSHKNEMIIRVGSGGGKGRTTSGAIQYFTYNLVRHKNIRELLNIYHGDKIEIIFGSLSKANASRNIFYMYRNYFFTCPLLAQWYRDKGMKVQLEKDITTQVIHLPQDIDVGYICSKYEASRGGAVILYILDECDTLKLQHMNKVNDECKSNTKTRFPDHWGIINLSASDPYKTKEESYMENKIIVSKSINDQALKENKPAPIFIFEAAYNETNPKITKEIVWDDCYNPAKPVNTRLENQIRFLNIRSNLRDTNKFCQYPVKVLHIFSQNIKPLALDWKRHLREELDDSTGKIIKYAGVQLFNIEINKNIQCKIHIDSSQNICNTTVAVGYKNIINNLESFILGLLFGFVPDSRSDDSDKKIYVDFAGYAMDKFPKSILPESKRTCMKDILQLLLERLTITGISSDIYPAVRQVLQEIKRDYGTPISLQTFSPQDQYLRYLTLQWLIDSGRFYSTYTTIKLLSDKIGEEQLIDGPELTEVLMNCSITYHNNNNLFSVVSKYKDYLDAIAGCASEFFPPPSASNTNCNISPNDWDKILSSTGFIK